MDEIRFVLPMVVMFFGMAIIILPTVFWSNKMVVKKRERATEVLKIYAERGEVPPQNVIDALMGSATAWKSQPPKPKTRGRHFSEFASCCVFAVGAAGIAWWQAPETGHPPGAFMILAIVVALTFTAGAVSHLVMALHIRDGQ
jgi:hypothetical protein